MERWACKQLASKLRWGHLFWLYIRLFCCCFRSQCNSVFDVKEPAESICWYWHFGWPITSLCRIWGLALENRCWSRLIWAFTSRQWAEWFHLFNYLNKNISCYCKIPVMLWSSFLVLSFLQLQTHRFHVEALQSAGMLSKTVSMWNCWGQVVARCFVILRHLRQIRRLLP